jgi:hypothetical protein
MWSALLACPWGLLDPATRLHGDRRATYYGVVRSIKAGGAAIISFCLILIVNLVVKDKINMASAVDDTKKHLDVDAPSTVEHKSAATNLATNMTPERRAQVEKSLKRKLDARCSLFVLIYIMNCEFA